MVVTKGGDMAGRKNNYNYCNYFWPAASGQGHTASVLEEVTNLPRRLSNLCDIVFSKLLCPGLVGPLIHMLTP